jgi:hypothetical protein
MSGTDDPKKADLTNSTKEDLMFRLPDDEEDIQDQTVVLEFTGQAWIDGVARDVDDKQTEVEVPLSAIKTAEGWAIDETGVRHYVHDTIREHDSFPDWVADWDGPFELQVKEINGGPAEPENWEYRGKGRYQNEDGLWLNIAGCTVETWVGNFHFPMGSKDVVGEYDTPEEAREEALNWMEEHPDPLGEADE